MRYGTCVGKVTPALSKLNIDWVYGTGINSLSDEFANLPEGIEFVPLTFEAYPNETWKRFLEWKSYRHRWLIGNEPHTAWDNVRPISEIAEAFLRQMKFIRSFDPKAKFIVACSTQGQLPYQWHNQQPAFIAQLWELLPQEWRDKVRGFHLHIYPRWVSDNPELRWNAGRFVAYLRGMRRWMRENDLLDRRLWVSEFGFEGYFGNSIEEYARCMQYVGDVIAHPKVNLWVSRLAFYASHSMPSTNWYCSLLGSQDELTPLGKAWIHTTREQQRMDLQKGELWQLSQAKL